METAQKEVTSPVRQDQDFRQKVVKAAQAAGHQDLRIEDATPVTAETQIRSPELQNAGAVSYGEDITLVEDALDLLGSTFKQARGRQGRAKRFLAILKGRLLKEAQQEGGELKEAV